MFVRFVSRMTEKYGWILESTHAGKQICYWPELIKFWKLSKHVRSINIMLWLGTTLYFTYMHTLLASEDTVPNTMYFAGGTVLCWVQPSFTAVMTAMQIDWLIDRVNA